GPTGTKSTGLTRRLRVEHGIELRADGVDGAHAVHAGTADRRAARFQFTVKSDEGFGLLVVDAQALADGVLAVVVTLYQGLAADVVEAFLTGRVVIDVIDAAGTGMHAAPGQALDDLVVGHVDLHHVIDVDARV